MEETAAPSCSSCTNGASKIQDPEVAGFKVTTTEEPQRFSDFCDCRVQCILCDIQEGDINDVVICHCPEGRGREGVGSLVVQSPRIGVISDRRWRMRGEDLGRCGED